jgi:hypothetical protein
MTPRFSPYASIKTLSFNTLLENSSIEDALNNIVNILSNPELIYGALSDNFKLFKTVGLANDVSVSESYESRPIWGIGEPTNPIVVPNNYSATISMSRMTLDTLSVRDFTTLPDYWYVPKIQNTVESFFNNIPKARMVLDYPFYTFLYITSVEFPPDPRNAATRLIQRSLFAFMPAEYSIRISGTDTMIMTDVRGTGKLVNIRGLLKVLAETLKEIVKP